MSDDVLTPASFGVFVRAGRATAEPWPDIVIVQRSRCPGHGVGVIFFVERAQQEIDALPPLDDVILCWNKQATSLTLSAVMRLTGMSREDILKELTVSELELPPRPDSPDPTTIN